MSVRLGVSPIGWSNDDLPELGGDILLDTCLAEAREADFGGRLGHRIPRASGRRRSASPKSDFPPAASLQTFGSATLPRCERPKKEPSTMSGNWKFESRSPPGESSCANLPAGGRMIRRRGRRRHRGRNWLPHIHPHGDYRLPLERRRARACAGNGGARAAGLMSPSKHGIVVGLTKQMALEFGELDIRVNAVAPGLVRTPMTERYFQDPAMAQTIRDIHAVGRWASRSASRPTRWPTARPTTSSAARLAQWLKRAKADLDRVVIEEAPPR